MTITADKPLTVQLSQPRTPHVELFATNLQTPGHMEWTHDGRLLVSEMTAGRVTDVTDGGDFRDADPYAVGLRSPGSICPLPDGRILVADTWADRIVDISQGGDVTRRSAFAEGLAKPYSVAAIGNSVYATERPSRLLTRISRVDARDGSASPHVTRITAMPMPGLESLTPLSSWKDGSWGEFFAPCAAWVCVADTAVGPRLILTTGALGLVVEIPPEGGDFVDLLEAGHVLGYGFTGWFGGQIQHPVDKRIYITQPLKGTVVAVDLDRPGDYRFASPVVTGLNMPTCVRFSPDGSAMYACSMPTGAIWRITDFA